MLKSIAEVAPELLNFIETLELPLPQAAWRSQPAHIMNPGDTCRVYTNEDHPEYCGFNYGRGSAIWTNTGDCAFLKDGLEVLKDQYCYP